MTVFQEPHHSRRLTQILNETRTKIKAPRLQNIHKFTPPLAKLRYSFTRLIIIFLFFMHFKSVKPDPILQIPLYRDKSDSNEQFSLITEEHYKDLKDLVAFVQSHRPNCTPNFSQNFAIMERLTSSSRLLDAFDTELKLIFTHVKIFEAFLTLSAPFLSLAISPFALSDSKNCIDYNNVTLEKLLKSIFLHAEKAPLLQIVGLCRAGYVPIITNPTIDAGEKSLETICLTGNQALSKETKSYNDNFHAWSAVNCEAQNDKIKFPLRLFVPINSSDFRNFLFFEFDLRDLRINQCKESINLCPVNSKCEYFKRENEYNFQLGNYRCICDSGNTTIGSVLEGDSESRKDFKCVLDDCDPTKSYSCKIFYGKSLARSLPLSVQSFCITACIVVGVLILYIRGTRVFKISHWPLLEVFLIGAILLYLTIVVIYFEPSPFICALYNWLRVLGFSTMYGTLLLRIYRILASYQSRKAHRVHVRDKDMLRLLGGINLLALSYIASWTAVSMDHHLGIARSPMITHTKYTVCQAMYWEIVTEIIEILCLVLGIYYCWCIRAAPAEYNENRYILIAFIIEASVSFISYVIRYFVWHTLHPDYTFLIYFFRCHLTVTPVVCLIIGTKFWYLYRPPTSTGTYRGKLAVNQGGNKLALNGDLDIGDVNLADMDPEDIRRELKKLYTNIEVYRTKAMRKDNPHISKRRGGRKQRKFSLQPFHKKYPPTPSVIHDEEVSKLSEDSVNSGDSPQLRNVA